jgi:Ser/Thr protein kinase RdoA (MazF antagonist)
MSPSSLEAVAHEVLRSFPQVSAAASVRSLGNHGGFSGAQLFYVQDGGGSFCLRAWPAGMAVERLTFIHTLMQSASEAGLEFVPRLRQSGQGSALERAGRLWELTAWMPGRADFRERPTVPRLEAACLALARLHAAWAHHHPCQGPCAGINRRRQRAAEWKELRRTGWTLRFAPDEDPSLRHWAERAWQAVDRRIERVDGLAPWQDLTQPLHPCLCDVWHDHVLFQDEAVSGLIDYGAIKTDHVSVDLARLLGSLVGDDSAMWEIGLSAYGRVRRLSPEEVALSRVLDETGTLLGAATWLLWLYGDRKPFADRSAVARHLAPIVERIEKWG